MRGEDIYYLWITNHRVLKPREREWQCWAGGDSWDLSGDSNVSISGSWHNHIVTSQESVWQGLQLSPGGQCRAETPLMRLSRPVTSPPVPGSLQLITVRAERPRLRCRPTFIRGHIIWVRPSKYQQKESPSWERDVRRTFYHFHFPIVCRPSHLSSVAAVASLNRRLQCISGDKRIVNKYWSRTIRVSLHITNRHNNW